MQSPEDRLGEVAAKVVRDQLIIYFDRLLSGKQVSHYSKMIYHDLGSGDYISREVVERLIPFIVDSTIEWFLESLINSEDIDLLVKDGADFISVKESIEAPTALYSGAGGWVDTYSESRKSFYGEMIKSDIRDIVQQLGTDPARTPKELKK